MLTEKLEAVIRPIDRLLVPVLLQVAVRQSRLHARLGREVARRLEAAEGALKVLACVVEVALRVALASPRPQLGGERAQRPVLERQLASAEAVQERLEVLGRRRGIGNALRQQDVLALRSGVTGGGGRAGRGWSRHRHAKPSLARHELTRGVQVGGVGNAASRTWR